LKEKERKKKARQRDEEKRRSNIAVQISGPSYGADWSTKKYFTEKNHNLMKSRNSPKAKNWPPIIGEPNFWSAGRIRPCLLNIKIFFKILAFTPHVKALTKFQPMRSTNFDNLKQQNGLDSSCKAALSIKNAFPKPSLSHNQHSRSEAISLSRVLFLASEYVSKQVRVVPSINRPTRVNPSVF
jgi:hypothetical protein